jgi:hypothetical protein
MKPDYSRIPCQTITRLETWIAIGRHMDDPFGCLYDPTWKLAIDLADALGVPVQELGSGTRRPSVNLTPLEAALFTAVLQ